MRRNPGFSFRTPESISSASGRVSEKDIRGWFHTVDNWLTENQIRDILDDPTRVFNGDETSFYLHPKSKEVIARIGSRNVYEVEQALGKHNITVMFAFGASGVVVNPHVILPGKRIRKEVAQSFPPEWGLGQSDRGWMDTHNFREYIIKIFHPFLVRQGIQLPVIFFVDGHASHKALEVADVCQSLGIVLICLYPNTTHITQPADVAVFKPLKSEWKRSVEEWRYDHQGCALTTLHFGRVLNKTIERGITSKTIQNGFRVCGLQPFDPNAVDYSKCIAKATPTTVESIAILDAPEATLSTDLQTLNHEIEDHSTQPKNSEEQTVRISIDRIIEAYDLIGPQTIAKIEGNVNQLTREERIIRYFYREFVRPHINFNDLDSSQNTRMMSVDPCCIEVTRNVTSSDEHVLTSPSSMNIDLNNCKIIHAENISTLDSLPLVVELSTDHQIEDAQENQNDIISCCKL